MSERNTDPKNSVSVETTAFPDFTSGSTTKLYLHDQYWGSVKQNTSGMIIGLDFGNWVTFFAEANIYPYAAVNLDPKDLDAFYGSIYFKTYAFTVTWPEGVQAFTASAANNSLNMNSIPRVGEALTIPADNGVILRRERTDEEDNISFVLLTPAESEPAHIAGNVFQGYENMTTSVQAPSYVLYGDANHGVGFYRYSCAKYQAFRAFYHPASPSAAPARISLVFNHADEATGVEDVQRDQVQSTKVIENGVLYIIKNGVKYNAQGQSLQERRVQ